MDRRIVIVTGGNSGVGFETIRVRSYVFTVLEHPHDLHAQVLLLRNAKVYMAARASAKTTAALAALHESTGRTAHHVPLDLASLESVKRAADDFMSREHELHLLFNNAAVMIPPVEQLTPDGYDLQWGTNVLGHFYLTRLLLPALERGAKSAPDAHARVVTSSSNGTYVGKLWPETWRDSDARRRKRSYELYFQSKLGASIISRQGALRWASKGIVCIAANPGMVDSDLYRHDRFARGVLSFVLNPPSLGALPQLYAGTMPEALKHSGEFFVPFARLVAHKSDVYDDAVGRLVWDWLEEQIAAHEGRPEP
ncbi:NAD(P)-binding protein [Epithele typhae]|uniref:NAD(P)-binding protein n=1 Tax=Epithele typhae TaxID=378194 RepID=UPI002007A3A8|nr:NAD(P)-binding protein [Epithele typhae]KAH9932807.1 NAD(P)-binding protein [Epithele typhae]